MDTSMPQGRDESDGADIHHPTAEELAAEVWEEESPAAVRKGDAVDADDADHALRNLYPASVAAAGQLFQGGDESSSTNGVPSCAPSAA